MDSNARYIVGIDEVGRGPIAGPVCVAAFTLPRNYKLPINNYELKLPRLRDSKKLSRKQREIWFRFLKDQKEKGFCDFAVSFVSSENIDKFGIVRAIKKALEKSLEKLNLDPNEISIYLDGGLYAPIEYVHQETIIKGDELHPIISMASIIAKVSRDRIMINYAKEFPKYGFEKHVGYGTRAHYQAIKKHGQTPIHRKTFIH
jgi:ribonuclease HII